MNKKLKSKLASFDYMMTPKVRLLNLNSRIKGVLIMKVIEIKRASPTLEEVMKLADRELVVLR
ncbi:hypothetical protein M1N20_02720 [Dehalococcoidia bacterium]|nr:hypothetical protein [Dehalococcoidia bacterium]